MFDAIATVYGPRGTILATGYAVACRPAAAKAAARAAAFAKVEAAALAGKVRNVTVEAC